MPDRADAHATAFVGDAIAEFGAFIAFGTEETNFHELVGVEAALEFFEELFAQTGFADLQRRIETLAEAAQVGFLRAGERKFVHGKIARSFVARAQVRAFRV